MTLNFYYEVYPLSRTFSLKQEKLLYLEQRALFFTTVNALTHSLCHIDDLSERTIYVFSSGQDYVSLFSMSDGASSCNKMLLRGK